ncbi:MutS-related protein [Ekhidna sp.]|uniref:MutS-related protein n=1 Tax=Ekhidna sp. TaxID=2608089 RepID=UPI003CCC1E13
MFNSKNKQKKALDDAYGQIKEDIFNFDSISEYYKGTTPQKDTQTISDRTYNDLDFDKFFMFIDRTTSKVGQQFLYKKIRTLRLKPSFASQEELIEFYQENQKERLSAQYTLLKLSRSGALYLTSLFQKPHLKPPSWLKFVRPLSIVSVLLTLLVPFYHLAILILLGVILINSIIHFINKRNVIVYLKSLPELMNLVDAAEKLGERKECEEFYENAKSDIQAIKKLKFKLSFFHSTDGGSADLAALATMVFELIKMIYLLEPLYLFSVLKELDNRRSELASAFEFVGEIDCCISLASLRKSLDDNWCHPTISATKKKITAQDIYHPLIPFPVKNEFIAESKSVILTGSNMSGKTTFIRTIGINFIAALTINTCFSKAFELKPSKIFTAIRINDDLMNDKSYYLEEVLTIKRMIEESQNGQNLFLLDELFKGTNTIERISAGKAVLSKLNSNDNLVFVSTHDIELTELLNNEFDSYHFCEQIDNQNIEFDYLLKQGRLEEKNAIKILEANGYPAQVISEAKDISNKLA